MAQLSKFERPYKITGADGLVIYESAAFPQGVEAFTNSDTVVIGRGVAVIVDATNSVFPRWDYSSAGTDTIPNCVIKGKQVAAAASKGFLGVAMELVPVGAEGRMATDGLVAVRCINPPAVNTTGAMVIGSATAGSVDGNTTPLIAGTLGTVLGELIIPAGTGAGQSGSLTQLIVRLGTA